MSVEMINILFFAVIIGIVFSVNSFEHFIIKRRLKNVKLEIPDPSESVSRAITNGELVRPENEDWLYLYVKRPHYSFRLETLTNEHMYVFYNGDLLGKFIIKRLGFSGYLDGIHYRYIDDTLSKYTNGCVITLSDDEQLHEQSYERGFGSFEVVRKFISSRKYNSNRFTAEKVIGRRLEFLCKFSNVYVVNNDTDILSVICQNYRTIYNDLYPPTD